MNSQPYPHQEVIYAQALALGFLLSDLPAIGITGEARAKLIQRGQQWAQTMFKAWPIPVRYDGFDLPTGALTATPATLPPPTNCLDIIPSTTPAPVKKCQQPSTPKTATSRQKYAKWSRYTPEERERRRQQMFEQKLWLNAPKFGDSWPEKDTSELIRRRCEGETFAEIAKALSITYSAASSRWHDLARRGLLPEGAMERSLVAIHERKVRRHLGRSDQAREPTATSNRSETPASKKID